MGPFFAVFHLLGVPVWVAQRLWLGLHPLRRRARRPLPLPHPRAARARAGSRPRWPTCSRPYFLQYAGRISVILLPWAGLPFMVGLTIVALRRGGWREPGPVRRGRGAGERHQRQLHHLRRRRARSSGSSTPWSSLRESTWRHALGTRPAHRRPHRSARASGGSAGLQVEAAYGVNVLKYTETVPSTSATSNAGGDHPRPRLLVLLRHRPPRAWTNAAVRYTQDIWLTRPPPTPCRCSPSWRRPSCAGASAPTS